MTIQTFYTKHKRTITIAIVCLVLVLLAWFVFRKVKDIQQENSAERELLIQQRIDAIRALRVRDSIALAKEDSIIKHYLGLDKEIEYRIIERTKYVTKFIDTASFNTKKLYLDSLFGPR